MSRLPPLTPSWYPTVDGNLLSRTNLLRWIREWARAHEITEFDYYEFGVLNGESITDAIRQLRGCLHSVTGFDTFSGIPALEDDDLDSENVAPSFVQGNYAGMSQQEVLRAVLAATDFPSERLNLIAGDFRDTLDSYARKKLEIFPLVFHLDCDLYSSSLSALNWCADMAGDGTWLLADDYWCYRGNSGRGQRRAVSEVFENHPRVELSPYSNYNGFGRAFIINHRM